MDQQEFIQKQLDIKSQFRQQAKSIIVTYYIISTMIGVSALLCIVSAANIKDIYLDGLQMAIIITSALTLPFLLLSLYSFYKINNSAAKLILFSLGTYLFQSVMMSVVAISLILTILQTFCGYFVAHNGYYDGSYIVTSLQTSYQYPTCSQIDSSGGNKQSTIYGYAKQVLLTYCGPNCEDMDSLLVTAWGGKFGTQLAGCIIGAIANIFYIVIVIIIRQRLKRIRETAQQNLVIFQAQQIANKNQAPAIQYIVVNPQNQQNNPLPPPPPQHNHQQYQQVPQYPPNYQPYAQPQNQNYMPPPPPQDNLNYPPVPEQNHNYPPQPGYQQNYQNMGGYQNQYQQQQYQQNPQNPYI